MIRSDQQIIQGIRSGDTVTISLVYDQFFPFVLSLVTKSGGKYRDAEDVFQDGMVVLYEKIQEEHFVINRSFGAFFKTICKNIWGNQLQKKYRKVLIALEDIDVIDNIPSDQAILKEEENKVFRAAFERLGQQCKQILQLFFQAKKAEEIQQIMGLSSVGYTRKRKFLCQQKLIEFIKSDIRFQELKNQ